MTTWRRQSLWYPGRELQHGETREAARIAQPHRCFPPSDLGHAGRVLDARALAELREGPAEAEALNDVGRAERHREEMAVLLQQLSAASAGGRRPRTASGRGSR